jgi:hypothetical protein
MSRRGSSNLPVSHLKIKINLNYKDKLRLDCKNQSVSTVWEIIAVCSEIHTMHINRLCGQNVEVLNFKPGDTYSDQWVLLVYILFPQFLFYFCTFVTDKYKYKYRYREHVVFVCVCVCVHMFLHSMYMPSLLQLVKTLVKVLQTARAVAVCLAVKCVSTDYNYDMIYLTATG